MSPNNPPQKSIKCQKKKKKACLANQKFWEIKKQKTDRIRSKEK